MKISNYLTIFSFLIVVITSSCSKEDPFAPYLKGDIIGQAYCADEYGHDLNDHSGITVYTEPDRKYSAVTDEKGRYVLEGVINGTYNLSFEKEGFGTMKMFGIQHLGGKPTILSYYYGSKYAIIYENITSHISDILYQNDSLIVDLTLSGTYRPSIVYMRLFFSTEEDFNLQSAEFEKSIDLWDRGVNYKTYYGNVSVGLPFISGETVYCKGAIYSDDQYLAGGSFPVVGIRQYYDNETHSIVFPNLSDETVEFSFTMP